MFKADSLESLREKSKQVTLEIIKLCGERLFIAREIGRIKAIRNIPITVSHVEESLQLVVTNHSGEYGLSKEFALRLLNILIEESKIAQQKIIEQ